MYLKKQFGAIPVRESERGQARANDYQNTVCSLLLIACPMHTSNSLELLSMSLPQLTY